MFKSVIDFLGRYKPNNLFGFILGLILLVFYTVSWMAMIHAVSKVPSNPPKYLTEGFFYVASSSAGIASALAIAILGATPPGKSPNISFLSGGNDDSGGTTLTLLYLIAWTLIGTLTVYHGLVFDAESGAAEEIKKAHQNLRTYGTTWFGMALSAVFVYLKIKPG